MAVCFREGMDNISRSPRRRLDASPLSPPWRVKIKEMLVRRPEDRMDEIGPVGWPVCLIVLVGVCYIDDSIYMGNLSFIEKGRAMNRVGFNFRTYFSPMIHE